MLIPPFVVLWTSFVLCSTARVAWYVVWYQDLCIALTSILSLAYLCYIAIRQRVRGVTVCLYIYDTHFGQREIVERVRGMFARRSRPTWINVEPLSYPAISSLVAKTLHRTREECAPLSRFLFSASSGNAFSARNILMNFQRQHFVCLCPPFPGLMDSPELVFLQITFSWEKNNWQLVVLVVNEV